MSDPFSTAHVDWLPGSAGRSSGFFEGLSSGYDQQYVVDSAYGLQDEVYDRWTKSISALERATGQRYDMPVDLPSIDNYIRATQGQDPSVMRQSITLQGFDPTEQIKQREPFTKANDAIKLLGNPDIQSMEDIIREVTERRAEVQQQSAQVSETGGFGSTVGQFIGAIGGSFSERDPLLVGTLPVGGFGRTVASRIATEMGVIGGVEAIQQYALAEPNRAVLGEEAGSPLTNVLFAMVGVGLLRGGVEGAGKLLGGFNEGVVADQLGREQTANKFWEDLRTSLEANPQSPSARAGIHILDTADQLDAVNPYAGSEIGTRRFIAELEDVQRVMTGSTDTAVARFLPEIPLEVQKLDVDGELVKAERSIVYNQLLDRQNRLAEIDEAISRAESEVSNLTVSDAITRVDQASGDLVRSFEQDLLNPQLTSVQRSQIIKQVDQIVESLGGAERIARAANDASIKPKKVLQSLRASRKAAVREFKKARNQFDENLKQIQAEAQVKEMVNRRTTVGDLGSQTRYVEEPPGEVLRHDNVETAVTHTTTAMEQVDDYSTSIALTELADDGTFDLGNGIKIPKDFVLNLEDADGNTFTMNAETIMRDLKDDLALQEAVKVCSI